ncbi:aminoglycoside phosphotransferase family protein [Microbacterium sp. F51-2R]|jgi:streptomycin 6-kinase|uniref:aminoglycoside phosphotransferase family protein n=1 Tax=Microbacterium sp. F51-2R TaxID=3445777 RepID=UPI003FA11426
MITVPPSFRRMPRWWTDSVGREWLDSLPDLVADQCGRWGLSVDGPVMHGSNALVVPVRRGAHEFVLRMAPPGDDVGAEAAALRTWDGRGTVRLHDADVEHRAMLLERLDGSRTLADEPLEDAIRVLAELVTTLAVPVARTVRGTDEIAAEHAATFEREWTTRGAPIPRRQLDVAIRCADSRARDRASSSAVDGDLHFDQVLAGTRMPWAVVDPLMLRGDPEYDLGRILWSRLDEVPDEAGVVRVFDLFVERAGVPADRARDWVVIRSVSYLLWGLRHGLTEDPPRCRRLLDVFAGR